MGIPRTRFRCSLVQDLGPRLLLETEGVEVVELFSAIMPTKEIQLVTDHCTCGPISRRWTCSFTIFDWCPSIANEVEPMQIVLVMAVIPAEYVHGVFKDNSSMAVSRRRWSFSFVIQDFLP